MSCAFEVEMLFTVGRLFDVPLLCAGRLTLGSKGVPRFAPVIPKAWTQYLLLLDIVAVTVKGPV